MKKYNKTLQKIAAITTALLLNLAFIPVYAASLTSMSDTMSRIKTSTASNHTIGLTTPTGVAASGTVTITFPAGFTIGSVDYTDIDLKDDGTDLALAATPSGTTWGAAFAGQVLTLTNGSATVAASSVINIEIGINATYGTTGDAQITNPASANTYVISIAGTFGDTGSVAVAIVSDDQFTVSASVDPSITFTLNDTTVTLGALSISSVSTDTTSFTVNTNAVSGYTVTATEDGNLRFGANDINDIADGTVTAGSEEYGISTSKSGQTITQTSGNNATATDGTNKSCASASGPVSSDSTTLTLHASMAGSTPAGAYSHTVTVIAAANF